MNVFSEFNAELAAFYALTVFEPDEDRLKRVLSSAVDWNRCASFALAAGAPLIFYFNAKELGLSGRFSSDTRAKLEELRRQGLQNGFFWTRQFHEMLSAFAGERIDAMPLKGLSLLTNTYKDEALRATGDLDVFIAGKDFDRARLVLKNLGYRTTAGLRRGVMQNHGQECVFKREDGAEADLHYRLFSWYEEDFLYGIRSRDFFDRGIQSSWKGLPVRFMRAEDELYYLLLTIFSERYRVFKYYMDIDALVRTRGDEVDWSLFERRVAESPVSDHLRGILSFLSRRLETPFPRSWVAASLEPKESDIFLGQCGFKKKQLFYLLAARGRARLQLIAVFLKWQTFKTIGSFRNYFYLQNGPPHES